jgi:hypothetical protein
VDPDPVGLGRVDRGHHVLVPGDQHRVGDGPVPGQRLHVGADLGVHALLLATGVEVAQAQLDLGQLGDDPLVDGGHPVAGRVVPVDPEQLAAHQFVGVLADGLDERDRIDPEVPARAGAEQQLARGSENVAHVDHHGVAGQQRDRCSVFAHLVPTLGQGPWWPGHRAGSSQESATS